MFVLLGIHECPGRTDSHAVYLWLAAAVLMLIDLEPVFLPTPREQIGEFLNILVLLFARCQILTNDELLLTGYITLGLGLYSETAQQLCLRRKFWRLITMQLFPCGLDIMRLTVTRNAASLSAAKRTLRPRTHCHALLACASLLLAMAPASAVAQQQIASLSTTSSSLPDAPLPQSDSQSQAEQMLSAEGTASVSGTVLDASGASVSGAQVTLTHRDGKQLHVLTSGANGEFTFTNLPAGSYLVIVSARGFAPFTSAEFSLTPQQVYEVPNVVLPIATANTDIVVRPTEVIAAEQVRAEEKQRLLGIVPNFFVSYVHDPAPLTPKQKFSLAAHDSLDWTSFVGISVTAGIEQANNTYAGYGQGAAGYGKRWAARFGDGRTSDFFGHAVFPSLFHQDPRYFYQGTGTTKSRLYHALEHPFIARSDSGNLMPNYSYLLGDMVSGALSNAYYPHADRGANLVFTNAFVGLAGLAGATVLQEFLGKRLTKNVPDTNASSSGTGQSNPTTKTQP